MRTRPLTVALSTALSAAALVGCGDRPAPPDASPASRPAPATTQASTRRVPLVVVPLSVALPDRWGVRVGTDGALLLNGTTPDGHELNVHLAQRSPIDLDALAELRATPVPRDAEIDAGALVTRVAERDDGLVVVQQTGRTGSASQAADLAPFRWTVRYIVPGTGLDAAVYELDVADLTQTQYERYRAFLRPIFDSVDYEAAAPR